MAGHMQEYPGASFNCCSAAHQLRVGAIDASPLPITMAPRNGSSPMRDRRDAKHRVTYVTAVPLTMAGSITNHNGKHRLIATMKTIIVSTCGHTLPIAFSLL